MDLPIAVRLRKVRRGQDLTQQELGRLAGINYTTISRIESGEAKQVYAETVRDLARVLGCTSDYLLGLSEDENQGAQPPPKRPRSHKAVEVG